MKKALGFISTITLVACVAEAPPPSNIKLIETPAMSQKNNVMFYRCKDNKEVRILRSLKKNKTAKNTRSIQVTFDKVTEKLISTVTEKGQKYTNIRWQWFELGENSQLTTSLGVVLAEQCIRQ